MKDSIQNKASKRPVSLLFVCHPGCSTCKKARDFLDEQKLDYTFRDIRTDKPSKAELASWHKASSLPIKKLFNTSGLVYRAAGLSQKLPGLSQDEQLDLLSTDGMLVKRPILVGEEFALFGFAQKDWESALNDPSNR